MIVDPDFFDHWRTRMVIDLLGGDKLAPIYVMRLWAHCQNRKAWQFSIPTAGIKALCQFSGDADALEAALVAADYITRNGDVVTVVGWEEKNASLIAAWGNGAKGGRPRKNPAETHGLAMGNPPVTHGKPMENPDETDKSREEKKKEIHTSAEPTSAPKTPEIPCPHQQIIDLYHRELPELPAVRLVTEKRRSSMRKFWAWVLSSKKPDGTRRATNGDEALAWIGAYFARAAHNDFLMGRTHRSAEHANWRADFDFLLSEKGMRQVIEKTQEQAA